MPDGRIVRDASVFQLRVRNAQKVRIGKSVQESKGEKT
jgi:hypothetical protein